MKSEEFDRAVLDTIVSRGPVRFNVIHWVLIDSGVATDRDYHFLGRRLQSLRKRGLIMHTRKGWVAA